MESVSVSFEKKYPLLTKPMGIRDISNLLTKELGEYPSSESLEKYEFFGESPVYHADATCILGTRPAMEDTCTISIIETDTHDKVEFYGVFDGHGGWQVSELLKHEFHKRFPTGIDYGNPDIVKETIRKVCWDFGEEIFGYKDCWNCGSTAIFALKYLKHLYVVNIGDSTAVIFDHDSNILLKTKGHKPMDESEKARYVTKWGRLCHKDRVDGILAVSRSFGDNYLNVCCGDKYCGFEAVISNEPDIYVFEIPKSTNQLHMVLGSDGLWDNCDFNSDFEHQIQSGKFSFKNLAHIANTESPKNASRSLVYTALKTDIYDNITALVVKL